MTLNVDLQTFVYIVCALFVLASFAVVWIGVDLGRMLKRHRGETR